MFCATELDTTHVAECIMLLPAGEPCIGARHVQQCMWTGRNKPDARVPLRAPHYQMLLTKKSQQWQDDNNYDPFVSTSQASLSTIMSYHLLQELVGARFFFFFFV